MYLGYLFSLGLGLLFGAALLAGLRPTQAGSCSSSRACCVGWIFMTRPFDAVLWAAAFGLYALFTHLARVEAAGDRRGVGWCSWGSCRS